MKSMLSKVCALTTQIFPSLLAAPVIVAELYATKPEGTAEFAPMAGVSSDPDSNIFILSPFQTSCKQHN